MQQSIKRVAIVGGARIPFCRSNSGYKDLSNQKMMVSALNALVDKYDLQGKHMGDVSLGAVISHSRDWNLAREVVLDTDLAPSTPAFNLQQACGTSLQSSINIANKIALGQIDCGIAGGTDTTSDAPIVHSKPLSRRLVKTAGARSMGQRWQAWKGFRVKELVPEPPSNGEPRTGKSMGQHCEMMAKEWNITREQQDKFAVASHQKATAAQREGFFDDLVFPCHGVSRDNNIRENSHVGKLSQIPNAFDKSAHGTLTAGNSSTLTDGASAVLLASEQWAESNNLPVLGYFSHSKAYAVNFLDGDGLLMAPTVAVSELLKEANLSLQDFDFYEIHEAFAAQVLCTLKAWESPEYCREKLGLENALGAIDPSKINVKGGSLAFGHPFAATGTRIVPTLAKILAENGKGRGLISVCTAGGMGVAAIVEAP